MKYTVKGNKIIFSKNLPKVKNGVRVWFSRDVDEREMPDYPIATTDGNGTNELEWYEDFEIVQIFVRQRGLFGWFGKWELAEKVDQISHLQEQIIKIKE